MGYMQLIGIILASLPWEDIFRFVLKQVLKNQQNKRAGFITSLEARQSTLRGALHTSAATNIKMDGVSPETLIRKFIEDAKILCSQVGEHKALRFYEDMVEKFAGFGRKTAQDDWYKNINHMDTYNYMIKKLEEE